MAKNNTIEINGKKYDVNTGAMVGGEVTHKPRPEITAHPKQTRVKKALTVSDVTKVEATKHPINTPSTTSQPHHHQGKPVIHTVKHESHNPGIDIKSHRPEPAKTLMRSVVQKPKAAYHSRLHAQSPTDVIASQAYLGVQTKLSIDSVSNQRLKHAKFVQKSNLISHYNLVDPKPGLSPRPAIQPRATATTPQAGTMHPTSRMLQQAVQQAKSHEQPIVHPVRSFKAANERHTRRLIHIGSSALIAVALIGVAISLNMNNVKLQFASSTAGFNAGLPTAQPYGFRLNGLSATTGSVALNYVDKKQGYTISEKSSNWDTITLKESFVATITKHYQVINTDGETIYVYGNQNATWVNNGIWYQIQSNGQLNTEQLIAIATSL